MSVATLAIAIVDDEAPVRKALGRLLRAAGFGVATFATGLEFLESLRTSRPDCAILDLHLPGLSGLEVQQELSHQNISTPCIIITGKDEPGISQRALASGAAAYLRKPLDEAELLAAINHAVPESAIRARTLAETDHGTNPKSQNSGGKNELELNDNNSKRDEPSRAAA